MFKSTALSQGLASGTTFATTIYLSHELDIGQFGQIAQAIYLSALALTLFSSLISHPLLALVNSSSELENHIENISKILLLFLISTSIAIWIICRYISLENLTEECILLTIGMTLREYARKLLVATNQTQKLILLECITICSLVLGIAATSYLTPYTALLVIGFSNLGPALIALPTHLRAHRKQWHRGTTNTVEFYEFAKWNFGSAAIAVILSSSFPLLMSIQYGSNFAASFRATQNVFGLLGIIGLFYETWLQKQLASQQDNLTKKIRSTNALVLTVGVLGTILLWQVAFSAIYPKSITALLLDNKSIVYLTYAIQSMTLIYVTEKVIARSRGNTRQLFIASLVGAVILVIGQTTSFLNFNSTIPLAIWLTSLTTSSLLLYLWNRTQKCFEP